jgi:hypothetical protein
MNGSIPKTLSKSTITTAPNGNFSNSANQMPP